MTPTDPIPPLAADGEEDVTLGPVVEAPIAPVGPSPEHLYCYRGTVIRVVDGDTVRVALDLGFGVVWSGHDGRGLSVRLYGVDTPELRGGTPETKEAARAAKTWLEHELRPGTPVMVRTIQDKTDSFGRYLAILVCHGKKNINELLVEFGLGVAIP